MGFSPFDWYMRLAHVCEECFLGVGTWKIKRGKRQKIGVVI